MQIYLASLQKIDFRKIGRTYKSSSVFNKILDREDITLEEVLNDEDFLSEIEIQNDNLLNFLNYARVSEMIDLLLYEPGIWSTSIKSFKTPFVIWETLWKDIDSLTDKLLDPDNNYELFLKLVLYFTQDKQDLELGVLNQTLASYVSKIITFLWLKRPIAVLSCMETQTDIIDNFSKHLYLTECLADLIIKFICLSVPNTPDRTSSLEWLQNAIMTMLVRNLGQSLDILNGIIRKWYWIVNAKSFFLTWLDPEKFTDLMDTSLADAIIRLIYDLESTEDKKIAIKACETLETLINNLFVKTPAESDQDLEEIQFGFKVETIAGRSIEEIKSETDMEVDCEETKDANKDNKPKEDKK